MKNKLIANEREQKALRVWLELTRCTSILETGISAQLRREFGQSFTRFDALSQLYRADGYSLPISKLAEQLLASTTKNITGLIDRMANDGLVTRTPHPEDRRSFIVTMTEDGKVLFEEMAKEHGGWINHSFEKVTDDRLDDLMRAVTMLRKDLEG